MTLNYPGPDTASHEGTTTMTNIYPSRKLATALTAAAFGFVVGVILIGSAPEEGTRSVVSVVSKYVLASDHH